MSKKVKFKIFNFTFWDILKKSPTYNFEKICFVLHINYELKLTSREYYFYFSLFCKLYVATFPVLVTPKAVYHILFWVN